MSRELDEARTYQAEMLKDTKDGGRPVFHFSAPAGWMNDPNGFSVWNGKVQLFFQYFPYDKHWDSMHWGHAESEDFIRWTYLPPALAPDQDYDRFGVFSGTVLVEDGRQIAAYTGVSERRDVHGKIEEHRQVQCLAFGDGLDFRKSPKNPIIPTSLIPEECCPEDFRDPKLFKIGTQYFILVAARCRDGSGAVLLYHSEDLETWEYSGILDRSNHELGRMWECPDLYMLDDKWILTLSPQDIRQKGDEFHGGNVTAHLIGRFDPEGRSFSRETLHAADYGFDYYAPQSMKTEDGRIVSIAWMKNWDAQIDHPGLNWSGMMSFPCELRYREGRVCRLPVRELEAYRVRPSYFAKKIGGAGFTHPSLRGDSLDIEIECDSQNEGEFKIEWARGNEYFFEVRYDFASGVCILDRSRAGLDRDYPVQRRFIIPREEGESLRFRILIDLYSFELFAQDGAYAATTLLPYFGEPGQLRVSADRELFIRLKKYDLLTEKRAVPSSSKHEEAGGRDVETIC